MLRKFSQLQWIDNDHPITAERDIDFLYVLQGGLLLALKEQGYLTEYQLRQAEEKHRQLRGDAG